MTAVLPDMKAVELAVDGYRSEAFEEASLLEVAATNGAAPLTVPSEDSAAITASAVGPVLRVLKGAPTDEELVALVVVLATVGSSAPVAETRPAELWGHPTLMHRGAAALSPAAFSVHTLAH